MTAASAEATSDAPESRLFTTRDFKLENGVVLPELTLAYETYGRLAVDGRYQGRRVGAALLADAVRRSAGAEPAAFTLLVDAKDDSAAAFYRKHGFIPLASTPHSLFPPIATALELFS